MATTKLVVHPPIPPHFRATTKLIRLHSFITATHSPPSITRNGSFLDHPCGSKPILTTRVADQTSGLEVEDGESHEEPSSDSVAQIKRDLCKSVQGINRGIFGAPSSKKAEIEGLVKLLESRNPTSDPTTNLDKVNGWWKLVYSTITILGSKRTKLGLRDFISLGDFMQKIDVAEGKAVNVIKFSAKGFNMLNGELKIEASFKVASRSRVNISCDSSTITPNQLMNLFEKNYDLLLSVFNPEGWLEITYVDEDMRMGRDDKGNIFVLERMEDN